MESLASAIRTLGARKTALEAELAQVNQELEEITAAIAAATNGHKGSADVSAASAPPRPATKTKAQSAEAPKQTAKTPSQRSWFEPGEALGLLQKLLNNPKSASEVVNEIVVLKNHQNLPKPDLERFKWATHSAIKAAVAARKLVRREGKVVLAPAARKAAKSKSKRARA